MRSSGSWFLREDAEGAQLREGVADGLEVVGMVKFIARSA
jgi:hypothetical protein